MRRTALLGLFGQLIRCNSTLIPNVNPNNNASAALVAAAAASRPGAVASICRDLRKLLLNRPYASKYESGTKGRKGVTADPEDEKMLSEGGGSINKDFAKECSRVKSTKRSSTIEKVLPGKRRTKDKVKSAANTVQKAAKKVTDKAKKGVDKAKEKVKDAAKKVKDTAKKAGGGGGGGGKKKGGGGGGKKKGGGGSGGGGKKGGGGGGGKKKGGGGGGGKKGGKK